MTVQRNQIFGNGDHSLLEISRFVEEMKQLEELVVCDKSAISDIPQGICAHLTSLRKLVICMCGLTSLPHSMGQLTQHLDLSNNKLQHLCDLFSLFSTCGGLCRRNVCHLFLFSFSLLCASQMTKNESAHIW